MPSQLGLGVGAPAEGEEDAGEIAESGTQAQLHPKGTGGKKKKHQKEGGGDQPAA